MFDKLKKLLEGGVAQVNPFDGGKTYQSVVNNRTPQQQNAVQQQQAQARTFRPSQPSVAPQQTFTNKLRDILDANTEADKFRRAQIGQATSYQEQQARNPNAYNQVAGLASKVTNTGPVGLFNDVRSKGFGTLINPNDLIRRGNPFAGAADIARQESNKLVQQNPAILNDPTTKSMYEMANTPRGLQDAAGRAITSVGNAPVIRDVKEAPGINVLNDMLISPILRTTANSLARVGSAGSGNQSYSTGIKGAAELGSDIYNVGTMAYAPAASKVLSQGGQAALRAIPGAAGRGFLAGSGANVQQQLADGARLDDISLQDAALSGGLGGIVNAGLPLAGGAIGRQLGKAVDAAGNFIRRPRSVAEIAQEVNIARTAPQMPRAIAENAPAPSRVSGAPTPRPASEIAAELAASKARAIDPNVAARRASFSPTEQVAQIKRVNVSPDDQRILADFNDIANGVYKPDARLQRQIELDATRIAEKYNIPLRSTALETADEFDNFLQRGVTKPEFAPKPSRQTNQLAPKPSKYKDADEFVKAQGEPVYHGTRQTFDEYNPNLANTARTQEFGGINATYFSPKNETALRYAQAANSGKFFSASVIDDIKKINPFLADYIDGLYKKGDGYVDKTITSSEDFVTKSGGITLTEAANIANNIRGSKSSYGYIQEGDQTISRDVNAFNSARNTLEKLGVSASGSPRVMEGVLTKDAKIKDIGFVADKHARVGEDHVTTFANEILTRLTRQAKEQGYDGVKFRTEQSIDRQPEIAVWNTDKIKTKKQLIEEFEQLPNYPEFPYSSPKESRKKINNGDYIQLPGGKDVRPEAPQVGKTDPLEALKAEARKYKSAEEFVSSNGTPVYKGLSKDGKRVSSEYGDGYYVTGHKDFAQRYDTGGGIEESYLMPGTKTISINDPAYKKIKAHYMEQVSGGEPGYRKPNLDKVNAELKKHGYEAVTVDAPDGSNISTVVLNKDALKTKQQLTDIYNQATKPQIIKQEVPKSWTKPKTAFEQNTGVVAPTKRTKGTINTERLDLTPEQRADLAARQNPIIETMSHKEVQDIARGAGIDTRSHTIEQTKEIIAKQLNTRGEMVALERKASKLAKEGGNPIEVGRLYARLDELGRASTEQGTDIARQLSARRILADESKTPMQRVFGLLNKAGVNPEVYTKKAVGVDFDNPNDVIRYYRELVPPTKGEWLDVVRYNSMLSSPLTQIVNISSTSGNIAIAPIERTVASGLDFINSLVTGKPRKFAGGEGVAYAKGMVQSVPDAVRAFRDSLKGIDENMNLDVSMQGGHIPVAAQGQNKAVDILQFPTKLLGAFDNYHRAIVAGGSDAALSKRIQAGINVRNREVENAAEGAYRTFNQEIGEKSQGALLGGIDEVTAAVNRLRSSKYAVVRLPAKFTLPFVRIGANLMKQGIEYSPAGIATIPGANDKTTQLAKALMGTAVFGTAAGLLGQDRLTWAEPVDPDQKAAFKQAGKQPYSMKIGNSWVGFSKLPPIISFNMAMVAALDDVQKNAKIDDNGVDNIITAIAKYTPEAASKYGKFLADQSYVKSVGDLLAAVQGDPEKVTSLVSNYPQQMVPMRAFTGWIAKMTDDTQRKVNTDAGFAAKQVESLMQQIPGLRQQTTARVNEYGEPIAAQHPVLNAFSPVPVSTENPAGVLAYDTMISRLKTKRDDKALLDRQKEDYRSGNASGLTNKQKAAVDRSIREDEVVKGLTPVQRELYKYSKEDLESLLDGPNAKNAKVALDAKNSISSSSSAKTNKEKYEAAQEEFDNPDNGYSRVEKVKKREELKRLAVQKDYDEDTTMLHGMSKEDVYGFLSTYEDGKAMADKLLALDDALTAAGVQDKNKFRDKYGNVAIQPKAKGGSKGRKGSTVVKGQAGADASARKLRALLASTNNKTTYRSPGIKPGKASLKKFVVKSAGLTSRKQA